LKQRELPELATDKPIEQILSLVTFGDPPRAMQSVIDTAKSLLKNKCRFGAVLELSGE
jgi:hypothetical protein